jgi:hypothetical protein
MGRGVARRKLFVLLAEERLVDSSATPLFPRSFTKPDWAFSAALPGAAPAPDDRLLRGHCECELAADGEFPGIRLRPPWRGRKCLVEQHSHLVGDSASEGSSTAFRPVGTLEFF